MTPAELHFHACRVHEIASFVRRRYPVFRTMGRARLHAWIRWHYAAGHCLCVRDADHGGKLLALGIARPVATADDGFADAYALDAAGPVLYVDLLVARDCRLRGHLWRAMFQRWGERRQMAYQRNGTGPLRVHRLAAFDRRTWLTT